MVLIFKILSGKSKNENLNKAMKKKKFNAKQRTTH